MIFWRRDWNAIASWIRSTPNFCRRWQEFLPTTAKDESKTIITKHNPKTFHNMRYYFPLSSALLSAVALLSPTTESFAPRSLTSAKPTQTSLSVSVSESLDGTLPQNTSVASVPRVAQRWRKSTKQLATLGPASSNYEMIEKVWTAEIEFFGIIGEPILVELLTFCSVDLVLIDCLNFFCSCF